MEKELNDQSSNGARSVLKIEETIIQSPIGKSRTVLTDYDVINIFRRSLPLDEPETVEGRVAKRPSAVAVAREYHISEKTVRDIWAGRTW